MYPIYIAVAEYFRQMLWYFRCSESSDVYSN